MKHIKLKHWLVEKKFNNKEIIYISKMQKLMHEINIKQIKLHQIMNINIVDN